MPRTQVMGSFSKIVDRYDCRTREDFPFIFVFHNMLPSDPDLEQDLRKAICAESEKHGYNANYVESKKEFCETHFTIDEVNLLADFSDVIGKQVRDKAIEIHKANKAETQAAIDVQNKNNAEQDIETEKKEKAELARLLNKYPESK